MNTARTVRILAMMEAASVTGPAKNLIGFGRWLKSPGGTATGLSIAIVTFDRTRGGKNEFVAAARSAGIDTYVIQERRRFDPGVLAQLRVIAGQVRPDIIQTHNNKSHLVIKWSRDLRAHRAWLAFNHGETRTDLKQRLYNQVDRVTLRSADYVVTVCEAFSSRLIAFGVRPERVRILHNAATPVTTTTEAERNQLRNELGIRSGEVVILTIGRLSKEKGHADLVEAVSMLGSLPKAWRLVIVGDGPERETLQQLVQARGLGTNVVFAGFRGSVERFYSIADLFVLPSHSEGSSNVLLEAMAARVPIITTRVGGNPEIILNDETGLLVRASDPVEAARAIERLLLDSEFGSKLAAAAFVRASSEFSSARYRSRLLGYYAEALGRPKVSNTLVVDSQR